MKGTIDIKRYLIPVIISIFWLLISFSIAGAYTFSPRLEYRDYANAGDNHTRIGLFFTDDASNSVNPNISEVRITYLGKEIENHSLWQEWFNEVSGSYDENSGQWTFSNTLSQFYYSRVKIAPSKDFADAAAPSGTYSISVDTDDGPYQKQMSFNGKLDLPIIDSKTFQFSFNKRGDLTISWTLPDQSQFPDMTRLNLTIENADDYHYYGYYPMPTTINSITIPQESIESLGGPDAYNIYMRTQTLDNSNRFYAETVSVQTANMPIKTKPTVSTGPAENLTSDSAYIKGTVNPGGNVATYYFEYGTTNTYGSASEILNAGGGTENVNALTLLTGLESGTTYYYRLVATNIAGTAYGNGMTFTTNRVTSKPSVNTGVAIGKTSNSATLTGLINPNGNSTTYYFQYGPTSGYGNTTATTELGAGADAVSVGIPIVGLHTSTQYFFRLVATNENGTTLGSNNTFTTDFQTNTRYQKAILVAGGGPYAANTIWKATLKCTDAAYKALLDQGFEKDDIYYLNPVDTSDPDGNGLYDDVSAEATNDDMNYAINYWALDAEDLLVYMVDHGGDGIFQIRQGETLTALALDSWLDSIQQYISGEVVVVYDACHAGSFVSQLSPPAGKKRTVVTSTGTDSSAYFIADGTVSFSFLFWSHISNGYSFYNSYVNAKNSMLTTSSVEALIDCNGNGTANEKEDKDLALTIRFGDETGTGAPPPEIGSVSNPQSISEGTSATISADNVSSYEGIQKVWAVITPPGYVNVSTLDPVTDEDLDTIDLANAGNDRYEITYNDFSKYGTYSITIFALDVNGFLSVPKTTTVTRSQGPGLNEGFLVTENLWIRSVIHTVDKGNIEGVWQLGGQDTTARGDQVVWGYFYADPNIMSWGSRNNPDLFVKIWIDVNGPVYVDYFHVSVPDIEVYTDYPYDGTPDEQGRATLTNRFVEHYYLNGVSGSNIQAEDGAPPTGYSATANPTGTTLINDLKIGAMINTVDAGPIEGVWRLGGQDTTARGDQVVWGYFYADPEIMSWGNRNNPDLFVKIWFDVAGTVYVDFFHVSVPDIEVYSGKPSISGYANSGTTILPNRFVEHAY